jgi:2-keto-4-pentenoate hydratase/2-oxohepta-3-ene-1,7-dioic acid hydratase in catechol pathway
MSALNFTRNQKFIALGPTFSSHQKEEGRNPRWPDLWLVPYESVIHENETIKIPESVSDVKPGVELTVVIGEDTWQASPEKAWENIAGFTISNDVTATSEWPGWPEQGKMKTNFAYKMFPTFSPILSKYQDKRDLSHYQDLELLCTVDGETAIKGTTKDLQYTIPEMISYTSKICRLQQGDLVALGDPGKVDGFLDHKNSVSCYIETIGQLTNKIDTNS